MKPFPSPYLLNVYEMECSPEALLTRPKKQILPVSWPQLSGKGHSYKSHYLIDITKDDNPDDDDSTTIHSETTPSTTHPRSLRVYPASPCDISAFIQELGCIRHRIIQFNDMSTRIPIESVPPYTQEILYLINHGYLIRNNPATILIPALKIIPHKTQTGKSPVSTTEQ
ncbi:hypothetical protein Clacol_004319 [Clathrus columnatus]|uniref:Uncharacterized protein n=1 Tax=Clathrus columnatus TaxID=1419009 RepID=A0AAV5ABT3_9AGAM|nr:hypothetical protein Clacol_004319 [Clathrus columnatus]